MLCLSLCVCRILWTTGVDSYAIAGNSFSIGLFNVLLWVLQILHVFWFIMIMTVLIKALAQGKVGTRYTYSFWNSACGKLTRPLVLSTLLLLHPSE